MVGRLKGRARAGLLVATAAVPLLVGGTALAHGTMHDPVPLERLVPGVPLPPQLGDTDDQGQPPRAFHPVHRRQVRPPSAAVLAAAALIEYVPADDAAAVRRSPRRPFCTAHHGPYQRQIERFLHLLSHPALEQSSCRAIQRYQRAHGIRPAIGFAGPVTWGRMQDERATPKALAYPNARHRCPAGRYRIACVDQRRQLMWVQDDGRIVFGPVRVRTGLPRTPTRNGMHRVYLRYRRHVSNIYGTDMPYSQFFDRGEAFHGIYTSLYAPTGSFGCVNLRYGDARRLWRVLDRGDRVFIWGHKPAK